MNSLKNQIFCFRNYWCLWWICFLFLFIIPFKILSYYIIN